VVIQVPASMALSSATAAAGATTGAATATAAAAASATTATTTATSSFTSYFSSVFLFSKFEVTLFTLFVAFGLLKALFSFGRIVRFFMQKFVQQTGPDDVICRYSSNFIATVH